MEYEVIDTLTNHSLGKFKTRENALYEIRLYCVQRMMNKISLFDQDFVTLLDNGDMLFTKIRLVIFQSNQSSCST